MFVAPHCVSRLSAASTIPYQDHIVIFNGTHRPDEATTRNVILIVRPCRRYSELPNANPARRRSDGTRSLSPILPLGSFLTLSSFAVIEPLYYKVKIKLLIRCAGYNIKELGVFDDMERLGKRGMSETMFISYFCESLHACKEL